MADDIAQWLEGLGLGQYAEAFAENSINFGLLAMRAVVHKLCDQYSEPRRKER